MRDLQVIRIVWLGLIAIVGILAVQTYWGITTWTANESDVNQKIHLALRRVAESLAVANGTVLPTGNIIRKRSANYYLVNIAYEIDANLLEFYLRKELEALTVNLDFEYAIFDCSTDEMVYGAYCAYEPAKKAPEISKSMPGYHAFTYYFAVKFPGRSSFLWGQFQVVLFFSVILFVTIVFFSYSLFVIIRQKWLFEQQKDFINNMTHEFKTPIASIQIATDYFLNHQQIKENERLLRYSKIIKDQNLRLNEHIERLLQLARFENNGFNLKLENIQIIPFLKDIVSAESIRFQNLGGTLAFEHSLDDIDIVADKFHLTNTLSSLLDNAAKFSTKEVYALLKVEKTKQMLIISIIDHGIGIPKDFKDKVFDKFFRVPTQAISEVKGFGIGLYYVKEVCKAHKWKINLKSRFPLDGTEINLLIPLKSNI
jgi:two-component system phosphate regulon sensor histidine kinase PhoR